MLGWTLLALVLLILATLAGAFGVLQTGWGKREIAWLASGALSGARTNRKMWTPPGVASPLQVVYTQLHRRILPCGIESLCDERRFIITFLRQ